MSVKANIIANYLGGVWIAVMGLAFVPIYIRYLGMESYGLIGLFAVLQSWLSLLDLGLTPTLSREMARYQSGKHTAQSILDLMRSVEQIYFGIAVFAAVGLHLASNWLASDWVHAERLSTATVANALSVSGIIIAARWITGLYRSVLVGLQRQVWLNGCAAIFASVRGLGAVAILAWVSPTIVSFFSYQGGLFVLEAIVLGFRVHRLLPSAPQRAQFRWEALQGIWRFAAGMATITVLSILLMQMDKLLLSKLLSLTQFGYYTLASTVAGSLSLVIGPVNNAIYPRLVTLVSSGETSTLAAAYHRYSQLLSVMLVPVAIVVSLFSNHILLLWTRDAKTTTHVAVLVSVLTVGTMFNGLMLTPYSLQLAYGWTRFTVVVNSVSVLVMVPLIYIGIHLYGAIAAAYIWAILNAGYLLVAVPIMHRKLLRQEMWKWYRVDLLGPILAAFAAAAFIRAMSPVANLERPWQSALCICAASVLAFTAGLAATPFGRDEVRRHCTPLIKIVCS